MGILSFIKKKVKKPKKEAGKSISRKTEKLTKKKLKKGLDKEGLAVRVLASPVISEKATALSEKNKYVFRIKKEANKRQVRDVIERVYGVKVLKVNIIKKPAKKRRLGKTEGYASGFKKAAVTLKKGDKIEIFEGV